MMSNNPFTYGNPITDLARFIGRENELTQILSRLRNDAFESSSIVGERRIGKTSLLNALGDESVVGGRWLVVSLDPQMLSSQARPRRFWDRVLHQLARALPEGALKTRAEALRRAEELDTFDLSDLFNDLDDAGVSVLLLLDEFERVAGNPNFGPDFFYGLRSLAIHHRLALVTASYAELSTLSHSEDVRSSPFFNIFATVHLGPFWPAEADWLFERYLADTGVRFEQRERAFLATIAGTHPYYLQIGGRFLFEAYQQELPLEERLVYVERHFVVEAKDTLAHTWQHSTDEEKISLLVLALLSVSGDGDNARGDNIQTMSHTLPPGRRARLRQLLTNHFDKSELRTLCFDLGIEYDDLPGTSRADKAIEFIKHLERRQRIHELVAMGTQMRPDVPWKDFPAQDATGSRPVMSQPLSPQSLLPGLSIEKLTGHYTHADPTLARLARRGVVVERGDGCALFSTVLAGWIRDELRAATPAQNYPEWLRDPANQRRLAQIRSDLADDVKERVLPRLKQDYWELITGWLSNPATVKAACALLREFVEA
jgi:hypothetical protein